MILNILNDCFEEAKKVIEKRGKKLIEVKLIEKINGNVFFRSNNFNVIDFENNIIKDQEQGVRMKVLFSGDIHCCYFLELVPVNAMKKYSSIFLNLTTEKNGIEHSPIPKEVSFLRDMLLSMALQKFFSI